MAGWMRHFGRDTYQQEAQWNCGMACVAMAINRVDGSKPSTALVQSRSRALGGWAHAVPAHGDRPDLQKILPGARSAPRDGGSAQECLRAVLEEFHVRCEGLDPDRRSVSGPVFGKRVIKRALNGASARRPVIVGLQDPPHFVLCEGPAMGRWWNRYVFIDPADGHVYTGAHVSDDCIVFRRYDSRIEDLLCVLGPAPSRTRAAVELAGVRLLAV